MRLETVYVMDDGDRRKIGRSADPTRRKIGVAIDSSGGKPISPGMLSVVWSGGYRDDASKVENAAHRVLKMRGLHLSGEWFSASVDECIHAIQYAERVVAGIEPPLPRGRSGEESLAVRATGGLLAPTEIKFTVDEWRGDDATWMTVSRDAAYTLAMMLLGTIGAIQDKRLDGRKRHIREAMAILSQPSDTTKNKPKRGGK